MSIRQELPDNWTLKIEPTFSRRETDDGFIIFSKPGLEIWAAIYCEQPFDPIEAIWSFLGEERSSATAFDFRPNSEGIAGRALLCTKLEGTSLLAVAASLGRIIALDFRFQDRAEIDPSVAIWHSLRHSPPRWVRLCGRAHPPLAKMREALERGLYVEQAIDEVLKHQQANAALEVSLEAMNSDRPTVRAAACESLQVLGELSAGARNALRQLLHDDSVYVRARAAEALFVLGEPPKTVVPFMVEALVAPANALPKGEDRIQGVCRSLCVPDRYYAARVLRLIGEAARPAIEVLLRFRMDESGVVRLLIAETLLDLSVPAEAVVPALRDGISSKDLPERERVQFARLLIKCGVSHEEVVPVLVQAVRRDADTKARAEALKTLAWLGPRAAIAADAIEGILTETNAKLRARLMAAQTLIQIEARSDLASSILIEALTAELDPSERVEILVHLVRLKSLRENDLEHVAKALDDENALVRLAAFFVLARNGRQSNQLSSILADGLNDSDEQVRLEAAVILGRLRNSGGRIARQTMPLILEDKVLMGIVRASSKLENRSAASLLSDSLPNSDKETRWVVEKSLFANAP